MTEFALIKMIESTKVAVDGINCVVWPANRLYKAPFDLARSLVKGKLASFAGPIASDVFSDCRKCDEAGEAEVNAPDDTHDENPEDEEGEADEDEEEPLTSG